MKKELDKLFRTFFIGLAITGCSPMAKSPLSYETSGCVNEYGMEIKLHENDPKNPNYQCLGSFHIDGITANFFGDDKNIKTVTRFPDGKLYWSTASGNKSFILSPDGTIYEFDAPSQKFMPLNISIPSPKTPEEKKLPETKVSFPVWLLPTIRVWQPQIETVSQFFNHDPRTIACFIQIESMGNPYATSPSGAQGLGQIMPTTWLNLVSYVKSHLTYSYIASQLEIDIQHLQPFDPLANIFLTNVYLDSIAGLPKGTIPTETTQLIEYINNVNHAAWKYHDGPNAKNVSVNARRYQYYLTSMLNGISTNNTCPSIAREIIETRWSTNFERKLQETISAINRTGQKLDFAQSKAEISWILANCR